MVQFTFKILHSQVFSLPRPPPVSFKPLLSWIGWGGVGEAMLPHFTKPGTFPACSENHLEGKGPFQ